MKKAIQMMEGKSRFFCIYRRIYGFLFFAFFVSYLQAQVESNIYIDKETIIYQIDNKSIENTKNIIYKESSVYISGDAKIFSEEDTYNTKSELPQKKYCTKISYNTQNRLSKNTPKKNTSHRIYAKFKINTSPAKETFVSLLEKTANAILEPKNNFPKYTLYIKEYKFNPNNFNHCKRTYPNSNITFHNSYSFHIYVRPPPIKDLCSVT